MQLWTDYEGVTIDGAYSLKKLLMPEGRSAFYSTASRNGEPTVMRLIECHFDEEEILARWRCVEALTHPNFLKFEHFGQTEIDGRPVVYGVFEKVDANLAEVLDRGHLNVEDVAQLASSLVAALEVLHTHGFIHEHIEPSNIFAIDGDVKMRSDCIREAPEGEEGRAAKQRDVRDLATVLLQGLTQRKSIEGIPASAIPAPFGQIIRNGLDGAWQLENIRAALETHLRSKEPAAAELENATASAVAEQKASGVPARPPMQPEAQLSLPLLNEDRDAGRLRSHTRKNNWSEDQSFSLLTRWRGVAAMAAVLLVLSTWILAHTWNAHRHQASAISQPVAQPAEQTSNSSAPRPVAADAPRVSLPVSAGSRDGWRVITFTYNRRTDAEKKTSGIARSHPELQPAVFTPNGHAPYLVSIGGVMDRDAAYALARRSHALGLPHDMFARNYSR